jgi:hypothetical protein
MNRDNEVTRTVRLPLIMISIDQATPVRRAPPWLVLILGRRKRRLPGAWSHLFTVHVEDERREAGASFAGRAVQREIQISACGLIAIPVTEELVKKVDIGYPRVHEMKTAQSSRRQQYPLCEGDANVETMVLAQEPPRHLPLSAFCAIHHT